MAQEIRFPQYPTLEVSLSAYERALAKASVPYTEAQRARLVREIKFFVAHTKNQEVWKH